jgi:transcriptional regulator with XRE-family HTH domain
MDDDEWEQSLLNATKHDGMLYHEICKWSPYKEETIDKIADNMVRNGYDKDQPVVTYEGAILDGRHRYVAAQKVGVDPIMVEFHGTRQEAIDFVTMRQVDRGHWSNQEKEYFYVKRAEALGVRKREDSLKQNTADTPNGATVPSQEEHADALGVGHRTVNRWEKDRKEIMSDPILSSKTDTFEGYREAKQEIKERKARTLIVPDYDINEAMGAIKGIAQMYGQQYTGDPEDAAQVLLDRIMEGYEIDDIGLSIARDYAKWFLSLKKVMDLVEPELEDFLTDKPNLTVVN